MGLFSPIYIGMDFYNNKILIRDNKFYKKEYKYDMDESYNSLQKIKELIKFSVYQMPFSLIRTKMFILSLGNESDKFIRNVDEIIYCDGKKKFREIIWADYSVIINSVFNKLNRCVYLVHLNNGIYGFVGFAGFKITKEIIFENNLSINWMIEQIKNEMPNNIPEDILKLLQNDKKHFKELNLNELWDTEEIIISLEPEYFYNKTKDIQNNKLTNNYIPNIIDVGMDILMRKFYNLL